MKKKIGLFLTVFCAMLLSACGGGNVQKQKTDEGPVDWKTKGFAVSGDIQEEQEFWAESYIKSEHETLVWNEKDEEIKMAIQRLETEFAGNGRVLIRPSGTEPLVRVMIEGEDQEDITKKAKDMANLIERKLK